MHWLACLSLAITTGCGLTASSQLNGARFADQDYPPSATAHFKEGECVIIDKVDVARRNSIEAAKDREKAAYVDPGLVTTVSFELVPCSPGLTTSSQLCDQRTETTGHAKAPEGGASQIAPSSFQHGYTYDLVASGATPELFERTPSSVAHKGILLQNHWTEGNFDLFFMWIRSTDRGWLYTIPKTPGGHGTRAEYLETKFAGDRPTPSQLPTALCDLVPIAPAS